VGCTNCISVPQVENSCFKGLTVQYRMGEHGMADVYKMEMTVGNRHEMFFRVWFLWSSCTSYFLLVNVIAWNSHSCCQSTPGFPPHPTPPPFDKLSASLCAAVCQDGVRRGGPYSVLSEHFASHCTVYYNWHDVSRKHERADEKEDLVKIRIGFLTCSLILIFVWS
jgi:hypothetical protein